MNRYLKWSLITLSIILTLALAAFFIYKLFFSNGVLGELKDKPTPEQQQIIDTSFEAEDTVPDEELKSSAQVYSMIHEMANTKIIAEDGLVWGLKPITKQRIEKLQKAVAALGIKDKRINEILERWSKQDFSQAVEDHNYIWSQYLNGNIGKAKALRK